MLDVTRLRVIDAVARHGSVTAAAKELHYSQPSVSHHLARREAETGAQLLQRVGRGIRLTPAGLLLADRAAEIIGRIDAASAELSAHVGLTAGRVRLAGFASAIGSLVPPAVAALAGKHPGLEISLIDTHPPEAIELLRTGKVEVAIIFRYDETQSEPAGVRLHHLLDDPVYLLSKRRERGLAALRDATWIAGCDRCRSHLLSVCADAGFDPRIGYSSADMVVMMALVAAGLGVATQTGLSLASGLSVWEISQAPEYLTGDAMKAAGVDLVNYAIHLPMTHLYGLGDTCSADGMRFYVPVDILASDFSHLLHGRGVTLYAHTGENAMRLHQEPIPCRLREATFVLDGLMEHETELDPRTVFTDTHGYTEVVMATSRTPG